MSAAPAAADRRPVPPADPWHAPLAPVALAVTAGVAADRLVGIPVHAAALVLLGGFVGWAVAVRRSFARGLPWLCLAVAGSGHGSWNG